VKSFFVPKDSKRKDFKSLTDIVISLQGALTGSQCCVTDDCGRKEGWNSGVRKSKVCTEPRTGGEIAGDWRKLPCQLRDGANLDNVVGSGKAEEVNFWQRDKGVALRGLSCVDGSSSVTFEFM
jgi:hypothetical protein